MGAIDDLRMAVRLTRQATVAIELPRVHLQLANLLMTAGDWDTAIVHAHIARSLIDDAGQVWLAAQAHAALASPLGARGDWATASTELQAADRVANQVAVPEAVFTARIARAALGRAQGDPASVIDALGSLIGSGASRDMPMLTSLGWWPTLIGALIDEGDLDQAARQIGQCQAAAADRRIDLTARLAGLQARLDGARGDADTAASGFETALGAIGPDDPALDRALLHHDYGRLLVARGERRAGLDQLRVALQLLERLGAEPYQHRVEADLASAGLRPTSRDRTALDLTDREHDVAVLVAQGSTNREAAAELYVSTKAIEYHLRNIFAKLGISSRRQVAAALAGELGDRP